MTEANQRKMANFFSKFSVFLILLLHGYQLFSQAKKAGQLTLFEPRNISTDAVEFCATFSLSGEEVYFARSDQKWGSTTSKSAIFKSVKKNSEWSTPVILPFSGQFDDSDPHLTKDGNTLYFVSNRPDRDHPVSADIWKVEKDTHGDWGNPMRLKTTINSTSQEYSPCTDAKGNLYFASNRPEGFGQGDLYRCEIVNGVFNPPINLGSTINSDKGEWNLEVNGQGNILLFEASERKENSSSHGDLYISFKEAEQWSIPQNIKELNTTGSDLYPKLIDHDNTLFFTSSDSLKSPTTNIYFVGFQSILNTYKDKAKFPE